MNEEQEEELESLQAIYDEEFHLLGKNRFELMLKPDMTTDDDSVNFSM
eukprot:gene935-1855_t